MVRLCIFTTSWRYINSIIIIIIIIIILLLLYYYNCALNGNDVVDRLRPPLDINHPRSFMSPWHHLPSICLQHSQCKFLALPCATSPKYCSFNYATSAVSCVSTFNSVHFCFKLFPETLSFVFSAVPLILFWIMQVFNSNLIFVVKPHNYT